MATNLQESEDVETSIDLYDLPEYLKEVTNIKFLNISIKGYEKKTSTSGFSKDEYYAYRVVSMLVHLLLLKNQIRELPSYELGCEAGLDSMNQIWIFTFHWTELHVQNCNFSNKEQVQIFASQIFSLILGTHTCRLYGILIT